jgi:hypothetical protein
VSVLEDAGSGDSASESEDWFNFFFHSGKEYDLESPFALMSGIRTHSLSNRTTRPLLLSMLALEAPIPRGERNIVLVVVATMVAIGCR